MTATTIGVSLHAILAQRINTYKSIEKQLEDEEALEQNLNKDKQNKFADEDAYNSEEERKKKEEALKKASE